jgi:hypothetical protein
VAEDGGAHRASNLFQLFLPALRLGIRDHLLADDVIEEEIGFC